MLLFPFRKPCVGVCSNLIFYRVQYFPAASHTLVYANYLLQQGYLLSWANISLLIAIRCCVLIINFSEVLFNRALIFPYCKKKKKKKEKGKRKVQGVPHNHRPQPFPDIKWRGNWQNQTSANRINLRKALRLALASVSEVIAMLKGLKNTRRK